MTLLHTQVDTEAFWIDLPGLADAKTGAVPRVKTYPWSNAAQMAAKTSAVLALPIKGEQELEEVWRARMEGALRDLGYGPLLKLGVAAASAAALDDLTRKALARALILEFDGLHANNAKTPLDASIDIHVGAFMANAYAESTWRRETQRRANGVMQEGNGSGPSSNGESAKAAGSAQTANSGAMDAPSPEAGD